MKASWSVVVLAAALASTGAGAQSPAVENKSKADGWLYFVEWVSVLSARGYIWSHSCQHGDSEIWKRAVEAADRLYQRCVAARSAVASIVESKFAAGPQAGTTVSKRAVTALAFERNLARASDAFNATDRDQTCKNPKLRHWLESGYVDPAENWEWFDQTLPYKMGTDPSWAEQPCGEFAAHDDPK